MQSAATKTADETTLHVKITFWIPRQWNKSVEIKVVIVINTSIPILAKM